MINDRIQYAAEVLLELGVSLREDDLFKNALMSTRHRDETLRSAFLARKIKFDIETVVTDYLKVLRGELHERAGQMDEDVEALMAVLADEDILTPADRAQANVGAAEISFSLKYEPVLELIERIWKPDYTDKPMGQFLWRTVLESGETAVAKRLAARVPPITVDLPDLASYVKSIKSLEVFVSGLSPAVIAESISRVHECIDRTSAWRDAARDATLIVLLAHHVRHVGVEDGWAAKIFDEILEHRGRWHDAAERALPHFAQIAKALGRLDDPRFFKVMKDEGLDQLDTFQLADLLVAGMPATLEKPDAEDEDERVVHLLEAADLDAVSVLAPHMSERQKEHFVRERLVWKMRDISGKWNDEKQSVSCLDRNLLTELVDAGFDLSPCYPDEKGQMRWLHSRAHSGYATDARFIFVTLHALGVYPKDLRYSGMSPLHFAAFHDDVDAIRALVEAGYEIDDLTDMERVSHLDSDKASDKLCTPLVLAAKHGKRRAFETLLELGADTGVKAGTGATLMQLLRDDEMKRMLKSARTTSTVRKAMSGHDGPVTSRPSSGGEPAPL